LVYELSCFLSIPQIPGHWQVYIARTLADESPAAVALLCSANLQDRPKWTCGTEKNERNPWGRKGLMMMNGGLEHGFYFSWLIYG